MRIRVGSESRIPASSSKDSARTISGILQLSGGIVFFIFTTVAEALYPGYDIRTNALSDLGALGAPIA